MSAVLSSLADVPAGFASPAQASQSVFRSVLDAVSRPGRVMQLDAQMLAGMVAPVALQGRVGRAMAALWLTLLDAETTLGLGGALATPQAAAFCRFHTGVRVAANPLDAAFVAWRHEELMPSFWEQTNPGTDEQPQTGSTLMVEVATLATEREAHAPSDGAVPTHALRLRGPGIEHEHRLHIGGPTRALWERRIAQQRDLPCGLDLILCCGERIAAIPRSTRVVLD